MAKQEMKQTQELVPGDVIQEWGGRWLTVTVNVALSQPFPAGVSLTGLGPRRTGARVQSSRARISRFRG
jgi:hypothetical protein